METIKFNLDKYKASKKCFVKTKSGEDVRIAAILKNGDIVAYVGNDKEASLYESNGKLKGNEIEGVKNDSYCYCKESAEYCLKDDNCCYICVSIINHYGRGSIIVSNAHWGERKKFVEVSRSKFEEIVRKNRII